MTRLKFALQAIEAIDICNLICCISNHKNESYEETNISNRFPSIQPSLLIQQKWNYLPQQTNKNAQLLLVLELCLIGSFPYFMCPVLN